MRVIKSKFLSFLKHSGQKKMLNLKEDFCWCSSPNSFIDSPLTQAPLTPLYHVLLMNNRIYVYFQFQPHVFPLDTFSWCNFSSFVSLRLELVFFFPVSKTKSMSDICWTITLTLVLCLQLQSYHRWNKFWTFVIFLSSCCNLSTHRFLMFTFQSWKECRILFYSS